MVKFGEFVSIMGPSGSSKNDSSQYFNRFVKEIK